MAINTTSKTSAAMCNGSTTQAPHGFKYSGEVMSHGKGPVTTKQQMGGKTPAIVKSKHVRSTPNKSSVKSPN